MRVLPSPSLHSTLPSIDAQVHIDRRGPSGFSSSIVPVVLLSILAVCILGSFLGRIAYLYYTGRGWTGCLQPSGSRNSSSLNANQEVIAREMTIRTQTFPPGLYTSSLLASPASPTAPPYSPATPTSHQPTSAHPLVAPRSGHGSLLELPKVDERASGRTSRLGRIPSLRGMSWGRGADRDGAPVQVHVRVSTVYDRPPGAGDDGDASGESVEGSSSGGCERSERSTCSPPPAYPGIADGHA